MAEESVWGIHAGIHGEADNLFLKKGFIALGFPKAGDMSKLAPDLGAFKAAVAEAYPEMNPIWVSKSAGQLYRFVHDMHKGDLVVYLSKVDQQIHIGSVEGDYQYAASVDESHPNLRKTKWLTEMPRLAFSPGTLYEINCPVLFQVKASADIFRDALKGKPPVDGPPLPSPEAIEQTTRDFVLKTLSLELKGHPFAHFVAHLLNTMGYRTRVSPPGPDGGVDIIAHKDELGIEPPLIKVQVKSSDGSIGDPVVSALYGKIGTNELGLVVTLGGFTKQAASFAQSKTNLRLIDGNDLVSLVLAHYEELDPHYKAIFSLKRVYMPQSTEDEQEE